MHTSPTFRHWHLPPAHSIVPQHSELARHALPGPVQHRIVVARVAQRRPEQHCASPVQSVGSVAVRHDVLMAVHIPLLQVSPGQQSLPTHDSPCARHTHHVPAAVPEATQAIPPQHPPPVHDAPGGRQH